MLEVKYVDIEIEPDSGNITTRFTNGWRLIQRFEWWLERDSEVVVRDKGTDLYDCDVDVFSDEENTFLDECKFDESMIAERIVKSDVYEEATRARDYNFLSEWI